MTEKRKRRAQGEGGLYLRADGRWEARMSLGYRSDGRRIRRRAVTKTKAEGARRLAAMRREAEKSLDFDASSLSVRDWLTQWLADAEIRPRTRVTYGAAVNRHLIPALGRLSLRSLTPSHITRYMVARLCEQPRPATPQTVKNEHAVLRRALEVARRHRYVEDNVARLVSPPRVERREVSPLHPAVLRQVLATAQGHALEALFVLVASTGLRRGEVLGLSWSDVDFDAGAIRVEKALVRYDREFHREAPKTKSSRRTIAVPAYVTEALRSHRSRQLEERLKAPAWQNDWDLVFTWEAGEPIEPRRLHDAFQKLLTDAGVRRVRFHDLRHGAATYLLASGVPMKVVQEVLGHSQMSITGDIYSHVLPELQRDAADRIGNVLFGA